MLNMITDWLFANAYMVINIIVVCMGILLVMSVIELGQNEVSELVEFYEEEERYEDRLADLNERA